MIGKKQRDATTARCTVILLEAALLQQHQSVENVVKTTELITANQKIENALTVLEIKMKKQIALYITTDAQCS